MANISITVTSVTLLWSSHLKNKENMATGMLADNKINKW